MDTLSVGEIKVELNETQSWGLLGYHDGREAVRAAIKERTTSMGPYQEFWELDSHSWLIRQGVPDREGLKGPQDRRHHVYAVMFRTGWDAAFAEARLDV